MTTTETIVLDDPEIVQLVRRLATHLESSPVEAVREAVRLRLAQPPTPEERERTIQRLTKIAKSFASHPVLDDRSPDEIIGYNEWGIPR